MMIRTLEDREVVSKKDVKGARAWATLSWQLTLPVSILLRAATTTHLRSVPEHFLFIDGTCLESYTVSN
jgi:hypothetical protein